LLNILVMAGGRGERFWPKSRIRMPKQLLDLTGRGTMIRETVWRVKALADWAQIYIITGQDYAEAIREQLPEIPSENIILEPEGRNTAPCIGLAAMVIGTKDPEGIMAVLASDHVIDDDAGFCNLLQKGIGVAETTGGIVTLGIRPNRPETGYGYIKTGQAYREVSGVYHVERFTEKPDLETACEFVSTGKYLWNSGIFIWKNRTILRLIKQYMPDLHQGLQKIRAALGTSDYDTVLKREFGQFEKISIDYGIMEKASEVYVLPADIGWDDVGSWTSLERIRTRDKAGNIINTPNVSLVDVKGCIIEASGEKLVAAVGIENLIYVETPDVVLLCPKHRVQDIKLLLEKLRMEKRERYL